MTEVEGEEVEVGMEGVGKRWRWQVAEKKENEEGRG